MRLLCQNLVLYSLLIPCFVHSQNSNNENHSENYDYPVELREQRAVQHGTDTLEHRAHDPTDELFNLVTDNPKPKRPLEPVKKWFENFIQNVANNARTQPTHSPIAASGSSSSAHYPTTARTPSAVTPSPETIVSTTTSAGTSTSASTITTTESIHSDDSDTHHHHHHHHSGKSTKYRGRSRHRYHHPVHSPHEHPIHYIPVYPSSLPIQYPMLTAPIPALPSPAMTMPTAHKPREYVHHLMPAQFITKPLQPSQALLQQQQQQHPRQYYSPSNFIMIPGPTQALPPPPPPPPQYPYQLPVPVMSYPYTRFEVERQRTNHYAQPSQPVPTKARLMKYVPESASSNDASSPDDYDTSEGEPVESRPALMFLDTQPTLDSEPQSDEQSDDPPADADDGQMLESGPISQSHPDDKAAR